MLAENFALATLKDNPADAEATSHRLLARGGFIAKHGAGLYTFTPLGHKVLSKVKGLVADTLEDDGAMQIQAPIMQPSNLWEQSGRWSIYQHANSMFTVTDRKGTKYGLAPTAEEVVTDVAKSLIRSSKQLPATFFQTQSKFRDEMRARYGLIRTKEFVMMDAYSFDLDHEGLERSYDRMADSYERIFAAMNLDYKIVAADMGDMGGTKSEEYMALSDIGEDTIIYAEDYAANVETAIGTPPQLPDEPEKELRPIKASLADHVANEEISREKTITGHLFKANYADGSKYVAVFMRGDDIPNDVKITNELGALDIEEIPVETHNEILGNETPLSPFLITPDIRVLIDAEVVKIPNAVCLGKHSGELYTNVTVKRDIPEASASDLRLCQEGDIGPTGKVLSSCKGIEIGHIFQLGTKYSEALKGGVLANDGEFKPFVMGCYGIGVSRVIAAVIEQNHDEKGIIWPEAIAPYQIQLIPLKYGDEGVKGLSDQLYTSLRQNGFEVMLDNRDVRPGVKFSDADLIGVPYQIIMGRSLEKGAVELKHRKTGEREEVPVDQIIPRLNELLRPSTLSNEQLDKDDGIQPNR